VDYFKKQSDEIKLHKLKKKKDKQTQRFIFSFYAAVSVFMFVVFAGYFL